MFSIWWRLSAFVTCDTEEYSQLFLALLVCRLGQCNSFKPGPKLGICYLCVLGTGKGNNVCSYFSNDLTHKLSIVTGKNKTTFPQVLNLSYHFLKEPASLITDNIHVKSYGQQNIELIFDEIGDMQEGWAILHSKFYT